MDIEISNQNAQSLPKDKIEKLGRKIGGHIFIIKEDAIKNEKLKTPIKFRSYERVKVNGMVLHTAKGGVSGLLMNKGEDEMFFGPANLKFIGESQGGGNNNNGNNNGNEKSYLVGLEEKAVREYCVNYNVLVREEIRGMIKQLENSEKAINEIIEADRD